jgi:hypothetical protein
LSQACLGGHLKPEPEKAAVSAAFSLEIFITHEPLAQL